MVCLIAKFFIKADNWSVRIYFKKFLPLKIRRMFVIFTFQFLFFIFIDTSCLSGHWNISNSRFSPDNFILMSAFPGVIPRSGEGFVIFSLMRLFFHQNFGTRSSGSYFLKLFKGVLLLNEARSNVALNMKPAELVFLINRNISCMVQ